MSDGDLEALFGEDDAADEAPQRLTRLRRVLTDDDDDDAAAADDVIVVEDDGDSEKRSRRWHKKMKRRKRREKKRKRRDEKGEREKKAPAQKRAREDKAEDEDEDNEYEYNVEPDSESEPEPEVKASARAKTVEQGPVWPREVAGRAKGVVFPSNGAPRIVFAAKRVNQYMPAEDLELSGDLAIEVSSPVREFKLKVDLIQYGDVRTSVTLLDIVECSSAPPVSFTPSRLATAAAKFVNSTDVPSMRRNIGRAMLVPLQQLGVCGRAADPMNVADLEKAVKETFGHKPYNAISLACRNLTASNKFFMHASLAGADVARAVPEDSSMWTILEGFPEDEDPGDLGVCNALRAVLFTNVIKGARFERLLANCNVVHSSEREAMVEMISEAANIIQRIRRIPVGARVFEPAPGSWPDPACALVDAMDEYVVNRIDGRRVAMTSETAGLAINQLKALQSAGSLRLVRAEWDTDSENTSGYIAALREAAKDANGSLIIVAPWHGRVTQLQQVVRGAKCIGISMPMYTDKKYWKDCTHVWFDRMHDNLPETARKLVEATCTKKRHVTIAGSVIVTPLKASNPFRELFDAAAPDQRETATAHLPTHIITKEPPVVAPGSGVQVCVVTANQGDGLPPAFAQFKHAGVAAFVHPTAMPLFDTYVLLVDPERWTKGELARVWRLISYVPGRLIFFGDDSWRTVMG